MAFLGACLATLLLTGCASRDSTTTTAAAPTTSRATATTTERVLPTAEDCHMQLSVLQDLGEEVSSLFFELSAHAEAGDVPGIQETHDSLAWILVDLPDMTREGIETCRPHLPQPTIDGLEDGLALSVAARRDLQQQCLASAEELGLDCDTPEHRP